MHDQLAEKSRADIQHLNMKKPDLVERRETVRAKDLGEHYRGITSTENLSNRVTRLPNEEAPEASQVKRMFSSDSLTSETQQKVDVDRSKWFKQLTWEQRMDLACEKGTLVQLQNLDPSYASGEIEDIVRTYLNVRCTAKVLEQSTFSSPHNGQALLIFKTEAQAEMVISELGSRCLMLPNGRPLIAQRGVPRVLRDKSATMIGHLMVNRMNKNREWAKALSTSHCAQPNTIEYELALDWILMQKRSEKCWRTLYEVFIKELNGRRLSVFS
ncbi:protein ANTI-SILENCING 1-like isoform X1 [Papaver somniferum]|uniref:protein ANTI-SILENCING 1-like isoform X1 n=1 Tax=Papaver somniferum TaxID=3469 RepID=UPI000E70065E|nr:protein ANTI-SILENCING 1-like isoform X1 [Papaver somniferum]